MAATQVASVTAPLLPRTPAVYALIQTQKRTTSNNNVGVYPSASGRKRDSPPSIGL